MADVWRAKSDLGIGGVGHKKAQKFPRWKREFPLRPWARGRAGSEGGVFFGPVRGQPVWVSKRFARMGGNFYDENSLPDSGGCVALDRDGS